MAWFKKGESNPVDYIKETSSVSKPMAVGLVVSIFLVGAALSFGLFMGGKWVVNKIASNKNQDISTQVPQGTPESNEQKNEANSSNQDSGGTPSPTPSPSAVSGSNTSNTNQTPVATTPNTGPESLPNTGPQPE